jgi:hypothetical protein
VMRLLAGWAVGCCVVLAASAASAQGAGPYGSPYASMSDFDEPYYTPMAPRGALSRGDGMALVPPHEVFAAMRDAGFLPTGVPRLRGFTYVISAIDRRGGDGRLVVDARTGEIVNFLPSDGYGEGMNGPPVGPYGPRGAAAPPPPPMPAAANGPRPPAPIPHVASRTTVPQPMPRPSQVTPQVAARPEAAPLPPQQAAPAASKPAPVTAAAAPAPAASAPPPAAPAPAATVGQAKPDTQILPTRPMPEAQGLEY